MDDGRRRILATGSGRSWPLAGAPALRSRVRQLPAADASALRLEAADRASVLLGPPAPAAALAWLADRAQLVVRAGPAWSHAVDVAVAAQATTRVFGPQPPLEADWHEEHDLELEHLARGLAERRLPRVPLGSVLHTRPPGCRAAHLLEAVVYDLEREPLLVEPSVERALGRALELCARLGARTLALEALGTAYTRLGAARFLELLSAAVRQHKPRLAGLRHVILTAGDGAQLVELHSALVQLLPEAR